MSYLAFHDSIAFVRGIRTDMHKVFHEYREEIVFRGFVVRIGADFGVSVQNEVRAGGGEVLIMLGDVVTADTGIIGLWGDGGSGTGDMSHGGSGLRIQHEQTHGQDCDEHADGLVEIHLERWI